MGAKHLPDDPPPYTPPNPYPSAPYTIQPYGNVGNTLAAPNFVSIDASNVPQFGKFSVQTQCPHCFQIVLTNVTENISTGGKAWAVVCCCFVSWIMSLLVLCLDCFKKWKHYCPNMACRKHIATYSPSPSTRTIIGLTVATLALIGLQVFVLFFLLHVQDYFSA